MGGGLHFKIDSAQNVACGAVEIQGGIPERTKGVPEKMDAAFVLLIEIVPHTEHETRSSILNDISFAPLNGPQLRQDLVEMAG